MEFITNFIFSFFEIFNNTDWDALSKLALAALIGIIIGLEREIRRKPTGIKTLIVMCVGSTLLTIVSIKSSGIYALMNSHITMDPLRLPAQIITGIGFLGAGVIMRKSNDAVTGLTTAAIIWGVGGIGIAIGADFVQEAIFTVLFFLLGVEVIPWLVQKLTKLELNRKVITIKLTMNREQEMGPILRKIKCCNVQIENVHVQDEHSNDHNKRKKILEVRGYANKKQYITDIYEELMKIKEIDKINITE